MVRTMVAVVAAYFIFAVLSIALFAVTGRDAHGVETGWFLVASTLYGIAVAAAAGFIAARIARRSDLWAPTAVAVLIAIGAVVSLVMTPRGVSHWSQWAALLLMAPAAIVGGALALRRRGPRAGA
jgi:hypothetical protein